MADILLAVGIAMLIPTAAFNYRWFNSTVKEHHWSGWASTICATVATFCIALGIILK